MSMITIIGAGPAGCYAALGFAKKGRQVQVFEEHDKIGVPIQCEGIVTSEIKKLIEIKKDFVIKDKRAFAGDAQSKPDPDQTDAGDAEKIEARTEAAGARENQDYQLPEINFATFIFSLNSSALLNLGVIEDPGTGQKTKNLPLAKQTIDILGLLEEKTQGNLTDDEASMLKNILYELRMLYVKESG